MAAVGNQLTQENSTHSIICSDVPNICKEQPCILGIDEAGRGPVIGPMVYGVCYCPISQKEKLSEIGFADSKTLTEEKRENLFNRIDKENKSFLGYLIEVISPNYISCSMLKRVKYSLNEISKESAMNLVQLALRSGVNVVEIYVDTVGDAKKYQDQLQKKFPAIKITVTPKADSLFPIVSAASICAKVARDHAVNNWSFLECLDQVGQEWGSGYPNDPSTKKWLSENTDKVFGFPQLVRFSWSTASKILKEKSLDVLWDDEDEDECQAVKDTPSIQSFFTSKELNNSITNKKHLFFLNRHLKQVTHL